LRVQNDCDDDDFEVFDYFAETKTKRVVLERVLYFEFFSFHVFFPPKRRRVFVFDEGEWLSRCVFFFFFFFFSRERRKNSTNYRINSYSGLNKTNNEVYARSMGSYYSRAKTFAENVLEQTMSFTKGKKRVATMMPIGVPRVPYKTPGENMWQWVDIWNCLYRERLIWIGQNIDDELGNQLVATMLFLDNLDSTKPMYLYINTEGGQVVPTMAIMDTMNHAKSKVGTVAFGSARAMGGLLLTNGEKGMRAALPNTCVMLHHPSGVARGAASDVQNEGRELLNIREKINKVVAKNCNQDIELVRKTINRDKHFTAEQAQDWGIIDKVLYRTRK